MVPSMLTVFSTLRIMSTAACSWQHSTVRNSATVIEYLQSFRTDKTVDVVGMWSVRNTGTSVPDQLHSCLLCHTICHQQELQPQLHAPTPKQDFSAHSCNLDLASCLRDSILITSRSGSSSARKSLTDRCLILKFSRAETAYLTSA